VADSARMDIAAGHRATHARTMALYGLLVVLGLDDLLPIVEAGQLLDFVNVQEATC